MNPFGGLISAYQFFWMLESHAQQRLAWNDSEQARIARIIAEARANAQHRAMVDANPSGQLGRSELGTSEVLKRGGLL